MKITMDTVDKKSFSLSSSDGRLPLASRKIGRSPLSTALLTALLISAASLLTGCKDEVKPDGFPELFPAEFTLTQGGQPLANASVQLFQAQTGELTTWNVFGMSDDTGKVTLKTYQEQFVGAPAGEYVVCVMKCEENPSQYKDEVATTAEEIKWLDARRKAEYRPEHYLVDPEYMKRDTSPLSVTIGGDGATPNTFDVGEAVYIEYIPLGTASEPGLEPVLEED